MSGPDGKLAGLQKQKGLIIFMPTIKILPDQLTVQVKPYTTVLKAVFMAGINLPQFCGQNSSCTTCRVLLRQGKQNLSLPLLQEQEVLAESGINQTHRLACQAKIIGDVVVERPT